MLSVIYRCCENDILPPFNKNKPDWFNKFNCFKSLIKSVETSKKIISDFIILYDGVGGSFLDFINQYNLNIIKINNRNNEQSLLETYNIADKIKNKNIYFIEDDYLHLPEAIDVLYDGLQSFNLVTGYDHLDRYTRNDDVTLGKDFIKFLPNSNRHWRTSESTCCTWACSEKIYDIMIKCARQYKLNDREMFRHLYFKEGIRLWNPIPAVTTQVDINQSPGIDWKLFNMIVSKRNIYE